MALILIAREGARESVQWRLERSAEILLRPDANTMLIYWDNHIIQ